MAAQLLAVSRLAEFAEVVPVSAVSGRSGRVLVTCSWPALPPGPPLYPDGQLTDEPEQVLVAEFDPGGRAGGRARRVAALPGRDGRGDGPREARRTWWTSTPSCTSSGPARRRSSWASGGERIKQVGTTARKQIEALLGTRVLLDLHVKVLPGWQNDPKNLGGWVSTAEPGWSAHAQAGGQGGHGQFPVGLGGHVPVAQWVVDCVHGVVVRGHPGGEFPDLREVGRSQRTSSALIALPSRFPRCAAATMVSPCSERSGARIDDR